MPKILGSSCSSACICGVVKEMKSPASTILVIANEFSHPGTKNTNFQTESYICAPILQVLLPADSGAEELKTKLQDDTSRISHLEQQIKVDLPSLQSQARKLWKVVMGMSEGKGQNLRGVSSRMLIIFPYQADFHQSGTS